MPQTEYVIGVSSCLSTWSRRTGAAARPAEELGFSTGCYIIEQRRHRRSYVSRYRRGFVELNRVPKSRLSALWREHGRPLLLFALLTVALTWPAARDFSSELISNGGDARNNLWMIWHVKEAILGHHPLFRLSLLYYPAGVNLLTRGLGPVVGLLALPFWPLGAEAAHNGSLLVGFCLTGYFMYLLGRGLGFDRRVAFFAGVMLLAAPMHLAGVYGHMTKTFLGLMPLALLTLHYALDDGRSRGWSIGAAVVLFFTLFHNGYQFVFLGLAFPFFTAARVLMVRGEERRTVVRRAFITAVVVLLLVGPFVLLLFQAAQNPFVPADANIDSLRLQPDLVELLVPPEFSLFWGQQARQFLIDRGVAFSIESNVFLSWTGLLLSLVALLRRPRRVWPWLLFAGLCVLLALGPSLKVLGRRHFTEYDLTVMMPYAVLTALPGFEFMRAPGRFMMIGSVALGVSAGFGLAWLVRRFPRYGSAIFLLALALILVEVWPRPWPQETLRPVPDFYRQIAADEELYGVFDLPVKPAESAWFASYASFYQRHQLVHHKGIASGYLARTYVVHPLFPCVIPAFREPQPDVLVDGRPASCADNVLYDLSYFNYRYVVYHKDSPGTGPWGEAQAARFLERYFGDQMPTVDDGLVSVYTVPSPAEAAAGLSPTMGLKDNWYGHEGQLRWAKSPATVFISMPQARAATLAITPGAIYEPGPNQVVGDHGTLSVELNGIPLTTVAIDKDETMAIPLDLPAGVHTLTLALEAGNFRPSDYGSEDFRSLSFSIRSINLKVGQ